MTDENLNNDVEPTEAALDEQPTMADDNVVTEEEAVVTEAEAEVEAVVSEAEPVVSEEEVVVSGELSEEVEALNDKVESAVAHVAEEAEIEAEKVEDITKDLDAKAVVEKVDETTAENTVDEPATKKRERRSKQARAEKEARMSTEDAPRTTPKKLSGLASLGVGAWLGIAAASLVLGLVLGRFVLGGGGAGGSAALAGKTTVTEAELDSTYATYTYKGATNNITVREVIEQNGTVESAKTADGTYTIPSAEYAVNVARTAILNKEVESRGITVTDEEITEYAQTQLGTDDFDAIASTYGMDADTVKSLIEENCKITALRTEVLGEELPAMPEAPTALEEGAEDQPKKEYADYIIKLAGDAWDSKKGEWADKESAYATALEGATFTNDGATYAAAQSAYYVAYQEYSTKQSEMSTKWADFLNGLLSNASIQVGTLVS